MKFFVFPIVDVAQVQQRNPVHLFDVADAGGGFQITRPLKSWKFTARSETREPVSVEESSS